VADDEFAASVREQVVPVIRHAVEAAGGRVHPAFHETELIDALASGRRPPHTRLVFGP
jgi:hypothetical protein